MNLTTITHVTNKSHSLIDRCWWCCCSCVVTHVYHVYHNKLRQLADSLGYRCRVITNCDNFLLQYTTNWLQVNCERYYKLRRRSRLKVRTITANCDQTTTVQELFISFKSSSGFATAWQGGSVGWYWNSTFSGTISLEKRLSKSQRKGNALAFNQHDHCDVS